MNTTLSRLLLVALSVAAFVGFTSSASAQSAWDPWPVPYWKSGEALRIVAQPGSTMKLVDDEWGTDEVQTFNLAGTSFGQVGGANAMLSVSKHKLTRCVGDEVRGELHTDLKALAGHTARYNLRVELHEGTSCNMWNLKGAVGTDVPVHFKAYETRTFTFHKKNYQDGDDSITVTLNLKAIPIGL